MVAGWSEVIGHDRIRDWFATAIGRGRLGGSFLFVGPAGVGKTTTAMLLARTLLCPRRDPAEMSPCGLCESCRQVDAGAHPDLVTVRKPDDRTAIPLDLLIGPPEARMREGFCRDLRLKPNLGSRKVAIVHDADFLNEEGANCLLKTLEEPPAGAVIVLIGSSEQRQLPTIRSRCQVIRFASPSGDDAVRLLRATRGIEAPPETIAEAIETAAGDLEVAARLLQDAGGEGRQAWTRALLDDHPDPLRLMLLLRQRVEAAGKEPAARRGVLRDLFSIAVQSFRAQMRAEVATAGQRPVTLRRLDRAIRALREVDRNANQATLIECFASDIAGGVTADRDSVRGTDP